MQNINCSNRENKLKLMRNFYAFDFRKFENREYQYAIRTLNVFCIHNAIEIRRAMLVLLPDHINIEKINFEISRLEKHKAKIISSYWNKQERVVKAIKAWTINWLQNYINEYIAEKNDSADKISLAVFENPYNTVKFMKDESFNYEEITNYSLENVDNEIVKIINDIFPKTKYSFYNRSIKYFRR